MNILELRSCVRKGHEYNMRLPTISSCHLKKYRNLFSKMKRFSATAISRVQCEVVSVWTLHQSLSINGVTWEKKDARKQTSIVAELTDRLLTSKGAFLAGNTRQSTSFKKCDLNARRSDRNQKEKKLWDPSSYVCAQTQWRRQRSKEARSFRGQNILEPGVTRMPFFPQKVDNPF